MKLTTIATVVVLAVALLAVLRFKPWQRAEVSARKQLEVGYLPVT